ncbi:hypothetical protein KSP40_PGU005338 [Platanthera guangdongensis]|uniref:Uncharacterized protein n=1 Tax=Platanthera guangdongensis TaxID=2320717 RepID=A0ABR2MZP7_9ASPA
MTEGWRAPADTRLGRMWGKFYWGTKGEERRKAEGIVVLFAWLSSQEKHLKPYVDLYWSLGWGCLICHVDFLTLNFGRRWELRFFPDKAATLARGILDELIKPIPTYSSPQKPRQEELAATRKEAQRKREKEFLQQGRETATRKASSRDKLDRHEQERQKNRPRPGKMPTEKARQGRHIPQWVKQVRLNRTAWVERVSWRTTNRCKQSATREGRAQQASCDGQVDPTTTRKKCDDKNTQQTDQTTLIEGVDQSKNKDRPRTTCD